MTSPAGSLEVEVKLRCLQPASLFSKRTQLIDGKGDSTERFQNWRQTVADPAQAIERGEPPAERMRQQEGEEEPDQRAYEKLIGLAELPSKLELKDQKSEEQYTSDERTQRQPIREPATLRSVCH